MGLCKEAQDSVLFICVFCIQHKLGSQMFVG